MTLRKALSVLAFIVSFVAMAAAARGDVYPTEVYPSSSAINALNGTTDSATGLSYIPAGTTPASNPPLIQQIDRRSYRENLILRAANAGRVVQVTATTIGVFPLDFRISGTDHRFTGSASTAVPTTNDTYYVYLTSDGAGGGTLNVVASGDGWPTDVTTYVPLGEVTVTSNVIASISDVRNRLVYATSGGGGAATTGTDSAFFVLDQDNVGPQAATELRFNRGSTATNDAAIKWDAAGFSLLSDHLSDYATLNVGQIISSITTGTAPFVIDSTTLVSNLNADAVDGWHFGPATPELGLVPYMEASGVASWTAAPDPTESYQVFFSAADQTPTWQVVGPTSGIQPYDDDLTAVSALGAAGFIVRVNSNSYQARSILAGNDISISDSTGTSGDITVAVNGTTQHAVQVGDATGGITSVTVGTDNTVLAGRTGQSPIFRKIVEGDLDSGARIPFSNLANLGSGQVLVGDGSSRPVARTLSGDITLGNTGGIVVNLFDLARADTPEYDDHMVSIQTGGEPTLTPFFSVIPAIADFNTNSTPKHPGYTITNSIGAALITVTLDSSASPGTRHTFAVVDADGFRIQTGTTSLIYVGASATTATTGYIESTTVGSTITLVRVAKPDSSWHWFTLSHEGTWTVN